MAAREQAGNGASPISADVAARAATAGIACLMVVIQVIFAGTRGVWLALTGAGLGVVAWIAVRSSSRLRRYVGDVGPKAVRLLVRPRLATTLANRAGAIAGLACLVAVGQIVVNGYIGWRAIVLVAVTAAVAFVNSNKRLVLLMLLAAAAIAVGTVFLSNMFRGSSDARTLAVAIAAVLIPVFVSDKLFRVFHEPDLTGGHRVALLVLTVVFGLLGWVRTGWLPGVTHGCFTLPTATGMTVLKTDGDRCYGLLDTPDPGVFARAAFGQDPVTVKLETALLTHNQPVRNKDLTVVWLGALSCEPAPADATRCADGRDYPAERDQLRALILAQSQMAGTDHRLHVVIADATQDVVHADDIAALIVAHRAAFGSRLVVIGGGDSRDQTQHAINRLLDNGVPFIAPNLLADLGQPGKAFVARPGYLQLAQPNMAYAKDTVTRLAAKYPNGFRLAIYQLPNPSDQYTTSLVNDLLAAVAARGQRNVTALHISGPDKLDASSCQPGGQTVPTVLFFADRWTKFMDFLQRINDVCGDHPPQLVLADGSVSRFMANYQLRETSNVPWAVDYYVGGPDCTDLSVESRAAIAKQVNQLQDELGLKRFTCADPTANEKYCTLDAAAKLVSQPCAPNGLGSFLLPALDAIRLAERIIPDDGSGGAQLVDNAAGSEQYLEKLRVDEFTTADGTLGVQGGELTTDSVPVAVRMWQAGPVDDPSKLAELTGTAVVPGPSAPPWQRP